MTENTLKSECSHYSGDFGETIDAVNPFSGKCCICGEQVRDGDTLTEGEIDGNR